MRQRPALCYVTTLHDTKLTGKQRSPVIADKPRDASANVTRFISKEDSEKGATVRTITYDILSVRTVRVRYLIYGQLSPLCQFAPGRFDPKTFRLLLSK